MNDPHDRFLAWLLTGTGESPPRDLALHASVCPECQRAIAAVDLLARVDPGRAPSPPFLPARAAPRVRLARVAAATAGVGVLAAVIGVSAAQLMGVVGRSPEENVLGATGTPLPTPSPEAQPTPGESLTPLPTPTPTPTPAITVTPITPPPVTHPPATPRPTRPPTPAPTATPVATATPAPTDSPTPVPTVPSAPLQAAATAGIEEIHLSWAPPSDEGGSPILRYHIYRGTAHGATLDFVDSTTALTYIDNGLTAGVTYYYVVRAVNAVGEGPASDEVSATPSEPASPPTG